MGDEQFVHIGCGAGGFKPLEVDVWAVALNGCDLEAVEAAICAGEWEAPSDVQVLTKEQHQDVFDMLTVVEMRAWQDNARRMREPADADDVAEQHTIGPAQVAADGTVFTLHPDGPLGGDR